MLEPKATSPQPFVFKHFGTFAGPQHLDKSAYSYDATSKEGLWHTLKPIDTSFKKLDLGAYLFNNKADYVGFHCDFVSTAQMTLEASYGNIPVFNVLVAQTNVTGNIRTIGDIHSVGNLTCNGLFSFNGTMNLTGLGNVAAKVKEVEVIAKIGAGKKSFDIPHPSKDGHRLRYTCIEGPEAEVYMRGKLSGTSTIQLPDVWKDLVDPDSIGVTLTPMGSYQELFVESINWGSKINVKNASSGPINCTYVVYGTRKDTQRNIPEYKGLTAADYPGDNSEYNINGL
tara:strand:- start:44 stop:895 length:852 start_codon:yes stop_codon:yes gene_type:complete